MKLYVQRGKYEQDFCVAIAESLEQAIALMKEDGGYDSRYPVQEQEVKAGFVISSSSEMVL